MSVKGSDILLGHALVSVHRRLHPEDYYEQEETEWDEDDEVEEEDINWENVDLSVLSPKEKEPLYSEKDLEDVLDGMKLEGIAFVISAVAYGIVFSFFLYWQKWMDRHWDWMQYVIIGFIGIGFIFSMFSILPFPDTWSKYRRIKKYLKQTPKCE